MQITKRENITINRTADGNLNFCLVTFASEDDQNPNLRISAQQNYVLTDTQIQSLMIEFDKVMTAIKVANGVTE